MNLKMKKKDLIEKVLFLGVIGVSIFLLFFVVVCTWIGYDVKRQCSEARSEYGGSCVEALMELVDDEEAGYRRRNSAIWALGQLGDSEALPLLKSYYTGDIPDREPLDEVISQYELKKAVELTSGGVNASAWIWRGLLKIDE